MLDNRDFYQEFLTTLNDRNVEYLILGGFAVNFYGFSCVTEDLDDWINPSEENFLKFGETLVDLGFPKEDEAFKKFISGESIILRLSDEVFGWISSLN